ncbi:MAG: glycosyltransferase family 2 protein [Oscillochloris sp.]|nr:glycosyltransferase family 2 protein [Oscillochloris sp.]
MHHAMLLSVAIIARDEQRHIADCLASVRNLADQIVVVLDDRTVDATETICRSAGALVFREPWRGFPAQRNLALARCRSQWVLFLDADERVTPDLALEIQEVLRGQPAAVGYWVPRHNLFFGRALRGGGWYPDHQLRLLRRDAAGYDEQRLVHEFAHLDGPDDYLHAHLIHINIEHMRELWIKQARYALAEARTLAVQGRRTRLRNYVGAPVREFVRRYIRLGGWRDGLIGLILCATLAWFELVKFACLRLVAATKLQHPEATKG